MSPPSSVERGKSSGLTLHVVPRNSGGPLVFPSSSQHHLIAILYSAVIPVVAIIIMILTLTLDTYSQRLPRLKDGVEPPLSVSSSVVVLL